jgi:hypothetical protein
MYDFFIMDDHYVITDENEREALNIIREKFTQIEGGDNIAKWRKMCAIPRPYVLPKDKDITRMRPVVPYNNHPLKKSSNIISRALMFILIQFCPQSYTLFKTEDFKPILHQVNKVLENNPDLILVAKSGDVKQMFVDLPHDNIINALDWILEIFTRKAKGQKLFVMRFGRTGVRIGTRIAKGEVRVTTSQIKAFVFLYLDTAFFYISGKIMRQVNGIPIGGPKSPPLAILSCAYNENTLLKIQPSPISIQHFTRRYIDDIISLLLIPSSLTHTNIANDTWTILTKVYPEQIQVEDVPSDDMFKFLGYDVVIKQNRLVSSLHNKNITDYMGIDCTQMFPRFPHFLGPAAERTKSSVLSTMLHAAHTASSTHLDLLNSVKALFLEFRSLSYPPRFIRSTFLLLIRKHSTKMWRAIKTRALQHI